MLLAFDTETTGLPVWDKPSEDQSQPHIVQLAAVLRTRDRSEEPKTVMNRIVRPEGWTIPLGAAHIHGITTERALDEGRPIVEVLEEFLALAHLAEDLIGFNISFDKRMLRIQEKRLLGALTDDSELPVGAQLAKLKEIELSKRMTKHCNLPPTEKMMAAGRRSPKMPKLEEAFNFIHPGTTMHNEDGSQAKAHDALTDIKMSMAIYWWLHEKGELQNEGNADIF